MENYQKKHGCQIHQNDKLAARVVKIGKHQFDNGAIDKKQFDITKKFGQLDKLVSADTLNRYVHSPEFAPSEKHLAVLWDSMADFIVRCLKT